MRASRRSLVATLVATLSAALLCLGGCDEPTEIDPPLPDRHDIFAALGDPIPEATEEQRELFEAGRRFASHHFTPEEGLGPTFNVTSCAACHERPATGGGAARYRNFHLVASREDDLSFVRTGVNGVQDHYTLEPISRVPTEPQTNLIATRNPIPFFGTGLIAEIPSSAILAGADELDGDGDGISGRPNYERGFVARFGRKAQTGSVEAFIRGPLFNHLGISSNPVPESLRAKLPGANGPGSTNDGALSGIIAPVPGSHQAQAAGGGDAPLVDEDEVLDPEISAQDLFSLVAFAMLLAAPEPDPPTPDSEAGKALFEQVGCTGCHTPTLPSPRGELPLYSDLLLHDMGPELADGVIMLLASGSEFRTQPLWGVAAVGPYLHDGRADTLDEAIRWHGGEAQAARDAYLALSDPERIQVIELLASLGGRSQVSEGSLRAGEPIVGEGELGGPVAELTGELEERFRRGREVFDRDIAIAAGLGPRFNGDSCRACHAEPTLGGAGSLGVNVMRQGIVQPGGAFRAPDMGTMAHHFHVILDERAPVDPASNVFEHRQTPPLFGLGLVDRIAEATILALEDPADLDLDGIRGVAHVLGDGRVGRLGWKANVPSVEEFTREAMTNEMGITLPDQPGLSFGSSTDGDDAADPELDPDDLDDLNFFLTSLAPPPRVRTDSQSEDAGEAVFAATGCDLCHVPVLQTEDGVDVSLYSDLLLHEVLPATGYGIEEGAAGMHQMRTPPLWGVSQSAPYMHDGRASSLEDAIMAHDGEALESRQLFEGLSPRDFEDLLAFLRSI